MKNIGAEPILLDWIDDTFEGFECLNSGKCPNVSMPAEGVRALVMDAVSVDYYVQHQNQSDCDLVAVGDIFFPEYFGIALKRNATSEPVRHALNVGIAMLQQCGEEDCDE